MFLVGWTVPATFTHGLPAKCSKPLLRAKEMPSRMRSIVELTPVFAGIYGRRTERNAGFWERIAVRRDLDGRGVTSTTLLVLKRSFLDSKTRSTIPLIWIRKGFTNHFFS
jgi:hypothetical protein